MTDLAVIPTDRPILIVCGTSTRKSLPVLQAYLQGLAWQQLPPNVILKPVFVADWLDPDDPAKRYLEEWCAEHDGEVLRPAQPPQPDFSDSEGPTHQWTTTAMRRVGANKDLILARAAALRAEYVWFVDADLICDRTTLWSLYHAQQPIVCGVYWTRWQRTPPGAPRLPSGPQVWLRHPYELSGRGMEEAQFRRALGRRGLVPVAGQGACTLIHHTVWEAGVSFRPVPGLQAEGLMAGEDRQFCLHAAHRHVPMYADAWPDIFHIYHQPEDVAQIPQRLHLLGEEHPSDVMVGDLVSLTLSPVEPVPQPNGQLVNINPIHVRGVVGALDLLPDIAKVLPTLTRGETRIVKAACGLDHQIPQYRGQHRLFKVTVVDVKPNSPPPVLEEDTHA